MNYRDHYKQSKNRYGYIKRIHGGKALGRGKKGGVFDMTDADPSELSFDNLLLRLNALSGIDEYIDIKAYVKPNEIINIITADTGNNITFPKFVDKVIKYPRHEEIAIKIAEESAGMSELKNNYIVANEIFVNEPTTVGNIEINLNNRNIKIYGLIININSAIAKKNTEVSKILEDYRMKYNEAYVISFMKKCEKTLNKYRIYYKNKPDGSREDIPFYNFLISMFLSLLKLQKNKYVHRDIKAENIMVCQGTVQLIDWGNLTPFDHGSPNLKFVPFYSSPTHTHIEQYITGETGAKILFNRRAKNQKYFRGLSFDDLIHFSQANTNHGKKYNKNAADLFSFAITLLEICDDKTKEYIRETYYNEKTKKLPDKEHLVDLLIYRLILFFASKQTLEDEDINELNKLFNPPYSLIIKDL